MRFVPTNMVRARLRGMKTRYIALVAVVVFVTAPCQPPVASATNRPSVVSAGSNQDSTQPTVNGACLRAADSDPDGVAAKSRF